MAYDTIIAGGTLIDGTGKPRVSADIAIDGERIADIGPGLERASAKKTVSAAGKLVTPGFIDLTSHSDSNFSLFQNPFQSQTLSQGVTTVLVGNCGSSLAPLASREAVQALRKWGGSDFNINWASVGEFLDELARHPLGVNAATLAGHGTIRRGITKGESRRLSSDELLQFAELVKRSMEEGAFGLSLGLVYSHEAAATEDELLSIARPVAEKHGVVKIHLRNESRNIVSAVNEAIQIARAANARVVVSHLKAIGRRAWPLQRRVIEMIDRARDAGVDISFDLSPYRRTGSFLYLLLPPWARQGGFDMMLSRIQDASNRKKIFEDLENASLHYDKLTVATSEIPNTNGWTLKELADRAGEHPSETMLELLLVNRGRVSIFGETLSFRNIMSAVKHPAAVIASDGAGVLQGGRPDPKLVHPRSTGAFPHFLHKFVKEKGLLGWEEGIRKITGLPAQMLGLADRGVLKKGARADIAVFDPETISDRATYRNPFVQSIGIEHLLVNGTVSIEDGKFSNAVGGQVLKKN